jgi:Protein of unknown function (DUF3617)
MHNIKYQWAGRTMFFAASLFLLGLGAANAAWATPHYKPGEWEYHWKFHMEVFGMSIPSIPVSVTSCVEGKHPFLNDPKMKKAGCKMVDPKTRGNEFSYTARCTSKDKRAVTATHYDLTFHGDRMDGTFTQTQTLDGKQQSTSNGTVDGKRTGPCTKKE